MKDTIIIVEGPQGTGKTTFTNFLREKMSCTDLYRLSGIKDKTETGHKKIKLKYEKLLEYVENCQDINIVFDRNFFTNEVYSRLGYIDYSFSETYQQLLKKLNSIDAEIYLVVLYLKDTEIFRQRLQRDKHAYQAFNIESSITQQNMYLQLADEVEKEMDNIKVIRLAVDDMAEYQGESRKIWGHLFN